VTDQVAKRVVSLPLYPGLAIEVVDQIVELAARIQMSAEEIREVPDGRRHPPAVKT
jgi:hypothetical protein